MKANSEQLNINKPSIINNFDKIRSLDVRPIINSGKDPFTDIMSFINDLKDDELFLLINSFEPIPLYSVLGKKGYEHYTEKKHDTFEVYFYKHFENENLAAISDKELNQASADQDKTNVIELDVRELEPPEPMIKILELLNQVDEKSLLLVHHHREPMMLYSKLEERGYLAVTNKIDDNYFKVVITKKGNNPDESV